MYAHPAEQLQHFGAMWEIWRTAKRAEHLSKLALKGAPQARDGHNVDLPNLTLVVADSQGPVTASVSLGGGSRAALASEVPLVRQSAVNEFAPTS